MKTKYIERPFAVKSVSESGTFEGLGSVFGELDSYRDIVMPGAFKASLEKFAAKGRRVPMLWQHNSREPIGVYTDIKETDAGLHVVGECNLDVQRGRECHSLLKQGALSGLSIGYDTVRDEPDSKSNSRKLHEVDLWEISTVTFPAGDGARVSSVKSIHEMETLSDCEDVLRDAGFSKSETLAFVSRMKAIAMRSDSATPDAEGIQRAFDKIKSITA